MKELAAILCTRARQPDNTAARAILAEIQAVLPGHTGGLPLTGAINLQYPDLAAWRGNRGAQPVIVRYAKDAANASVTGGRDAALRRPVRVRRPCQSISIHHRRMTDAERIPLPEAALDVERQADIQRIGRRAGVVLPDSGENARAGEIM